MIPPRNSTWAFSTFHGRGIPQDFVESHKWLNLAASRFLAAEADKRARALKNRDIVAKKLTRWRIAEAQKLAREWKPTTPGGRP